MSLFRNFVPSSPFFVPTYRDFRCVSSVSLCCGRIPTFNWSYRLLSWSVSGWSTCSQVAVHCRTSLVKSHLPSSYLLPTETFSQVSFVDFHSCLLCNHFYESVWPRWDLCSMVLSLDFQSHVTPIGIVVVWCLVQEDRSDLVLGWNFRITFLFISKGPCLLINGNMIDGT